MVTDEKKEVVVNSYRETYDKGLAYKKAGLSEFEIELLEKDEDFQSRLMYFIIEQRERIIHNYKTFMDSDNEQIAFKATQDFAKLIYPDFFNNLKDKEKDKDLNVNLNVNKKDIEEEDERIREEYGTLLGKPDMFRNTK